MSGAKRTVLRPDKNGYFDPFGPGAAAPQRAACAADCRRRPAADGLFVGPDPEHDEPQTDGDRRADQATRAVTRRDPSGQHGSALELLEHARLHGDAHVRRGRRPSERGGSSARGPPTGCGFSLTPRAARARVALEPQEMLDKHTSELGKKKKELKELERLHKTQRDWESDTPGAAACMCLM